MSQPNQSAPKNPTSHLHALNLIVALLAGVVSITGGVYSLKNNLFSSQQYGSLQGIVRDEKIAKPLLLTAVEISAADGAVVNTANTDESGQYRVEKIKTGNYVLKFTAPRHLVQTKTVKIEKDLTSTVNVDLVPEEQSAAKLQSEINQPVQGAVYPGVPYSNSPAAISGSVPQGAGTFSTAPVSQSYGTAQGGTMNSQTTPPGFPSSYGQGTGAPDFSGPSQGSFHHRGRRNVYNESSENPSNSSQSQGNALAQIGMQLLQGYATQKSDNSTSS